MNQAAAKTQVDVAASLALILARIEAAARAAGRDPALVRLVAVTKFQPPERILPALGAGQRCFAENRVQEAEAKWPPLCAAFPGISLHLTGPLQTNKARQAAALFDVIETLDRPKLARALADAIAASGKAPEIYVQVNSGLEPQKAGVPAAAADGFIASCRREYGLRISGLMCLPPQHDPPAPHFALLAEIARQNGIENLSMGMSGDFEAAIAHGATHVRIGTAIFGARSSYGFTT